MTLPQAKHPFGPASDDIIRQPTDRRRLAIREEGWQERIDIERIGENERVRDRRVAFAVDRLTHPPRPVPANDNQAWPLAEQLRRDGDEVLLRVAERYRAMYDAATVEASLLGTMPDPDMSIDRRVHNRADGSVGYKGVRRIKGAVGVFDGDDGNYKVAALVERDARDDIESGPVVFLPRRAKPVTKKWSGDNLLIAAIDARPLLRRLTLALGPLRLAFEDAVLHSVSFTEIGKAKGGNSATAGAIGRAFVMDALEIMQRELRDVDRESRSTA